MSMDWLLKAEEQPFVSPPVNFSNFVYFAKTAEEGLRKFTQSASVLENFQRETECSREISENLMRILDVSDLRAPNSRFNREMDSSLQRNCLMSQGILIEENSRRRNAQYKSIAHRALKFDQFERKALARKSPYFCDGEDGNKDDRVKEEEKEEEETALESKFVDNLIISISIYIGYSRELEYHEIRLGRLMKVTDRLELTGNHTLLDLKNAFSCPVDYAFTEDFSERVPTVEDFAKNKFPSAMFFIHDTFYIEAQHEDPSLHIRKWARKRKYIGPMNVALMSEKKLGDLFCRLGQPYVFIHQGVCEHLIVFNDLSQRDESHENVEFPRRLVERNFRRVACDICKESSAKWMIVEHEDMLPNSPGYLCSSCYHEFCFDVNGNRTGDFKAVPFCDRKEVGDGGKFISELRFEGASKKEESV